MLYFKLEMVGSDNSEREFIFELVKLNKSWGYMQLSQITDVSLIDDVLSTEIYKYNPDIHDGGNTYFSNHWISRYSTELDTFVLIGAVWNDWFQNPFNTYYIEL